MITTTATLFHDDSRTSPLEPSVALRSHSRHYCLPRIAAVGFVGVVLGILANDVWSADVAIGREAREEKIQTPDKKEIQSTVYREMEFRGLKIRMLGGDNALLRTNEQGALETLSALNDNTGAVLVSTLLGIPPSKRDILPLPVVPALAGYPGIVVSRNPAGEQSVVFELSRPARVYAYLDWRNAPSPDEKLGWQRFTADATARHSVYFRDFSAGKNELKLGAGYFCGIGVSPLDNLGAAEKIIAHVLVDGTVPALNIRSEHAETQELTLSYVWRRPGQDRPLASRETTIKVRPGQNRLPLPADGALEGILYWGDISLKGAGGDWKLSAPYGRFPPPPPDVSVQAPIFPYGAYMKVATNDDPGIYDAVLAATFYQMRQLKMNTVVLNTAEAPRAHLDLAHSFGLKTVVRLNHAGSEVQETMMKHPAILTYMIGDEPQIGEKLDAHIPKFEALTKKYPQFKPITCTIFDSWGTGDVRDPDRIYNDHLNKYNLIRLGRYYPFRKLDYGVGKPVGYKTTMDATSIMIGLEADTAREWWLVPPFFGSSPNAPLPAQFWRTPNGLEITNLMHLALVHRCTGLLGWGTHNHGGLRGLLFDGKTMEITSAETYAAMVRFGEQVTRIKPVLQAFTTSLLQIHRTRPFALDAQGRWLKTGQMAIYAVNRDLENDANADLLVMVADRAEAKAGKKAIQSEILVSEIDSIKDAITGREVGWKHEVLDRRFDYLRITDRIAPGESRLYVVYGRHKGGFSEKAIPPGAREQLFDKAYSSID